ncbi:hypothetical protein EBT31_05185 [bacterium]|nr:hypothetical protein [bacterium]NBX49132.1 hypothetical protein [bacterium]
MFSWRFRLVAMGTTLLCAGIAFLGTFFFLGRSLVPSWPYFLSMVVSAVVTQIILVFLMPRIVRGK